MSAHPLINFREPELPEPTDLVRGQPPIVDPPIHGVLRNAEVLRYLVDRDPGFVGHRELRTDGSRGNRRPRGPPGHSCVPSRAVGASDGIQYSAD